MQQEQTRFDFYDKLKLPPANFDSSLYDSFSEAKCAKALERYFNWTPKRGVTCQVDIGHNRRADFKLNNLLIEFHPIIMWRELSSVSALVKLKDFYDKLTKDDKAELKEILELELEMQYRHKRMSQLESCPSVELRRCKLIFCNSETEFYNKVLVPYSKNKLPSLTEFVRRWRENRI